MEGAPHTAKTNLGEPLGCPLATYIKEGEEEAGGQEGRAIGGVQLRFPILVGLPFLFQEGERGKEEEREKERGGSGPLPSPIQACHGGGTLVALLSFPPRPMKAHHFPGIPVTPWY